ncbi:MAG TPA: STAS domain-containing protein [Thermoanaerobaculia bacterium]|nr:STAS domain-containing protein [Thermoanaerobaculia bacterium]
MFEIESGADGAVLLIGRLDASQVEKAKSVLLALDRDCTVDFAQLDYISSAGLGVLLATQKKLGQRGCALKLARVNNHIRDVLHFSGFDQIFVIE